jgi:hypothetical protein
MVFRQQKSKGSISVSRRNNLNHHGKLTTRDLNSLTLLFALCSSKIIWILQWQQSKPEFLNPTRWSTRLKAQVPGFDRVTRVNSIFKKNQNDVVLVKKQKQKSTGCNWIFDQVLPGQMGRWVTPDFNFLYFFLNLVQFQPRIPDQPAGPSWISKLWSKLQFSLERFHSVCFLCK